MNTWRILGVLAAVAGLGVALPGAQAQVYRCTAADGKVSVGDRPCPEGVPGKVLEGLPGVPVPAATAASGSGGARRAVVDSATCERLRQRLRSYGYEGAAQRSAAGVRYDVDRYRQECLGDTRTLEAAQDAKIRAEFADQACGIKRRAVQEGQQKLGTMSDNDRRAHNAMAAEVARDC